MQEEPENDVDMNGSAQNGSHSGNPDASVDLGTKEDSFNEMGISFFLSSQISRLFIRHIIWKFIEVDGAGPSCIRRQICGGNQAAIEKTLTFGRELQTLSVNLRRQHGKNEANKKMLRVFSIP